MNVAVIGAGAAGLAAGYELSKKGVRVHLFERDRTLGGLAGSFELEGGWVEKYYHFICLPDSTYLSMLRELELDHRLRWRLTEMGQYYDGRLYSFGRALDLLRFPYLSWSDKLRFGLRIMKIKSSRWTDWKAIEDIPVDQWLLEMFGPNVYRILHEPLIRLKFGSYRSKLSASWMWARIHRLGKSRTRIRQREKVGYLEGGSQLLMDKLGKRIGEQGGTITLEASVDRLLIDGSSIRGISVAGRDMEFDAVLSTVPLPAFLRLIPPSLEGKYWTVLRSIESIGVLCVFLRVSKSLSRFFWINISDPSIELAGVIEYTNLNPLPHLKGDSIIYLPQYLPSTAEKFSRANSEIIAEYIGYLKKIDPAFSEDQIKDALVFRDKYAQPICETGFSSAIPDIRTPLKGLYLTDSSQLHPDDRTISNSLGLGARAAGFILDDGGVVPQQ